MSREIICPYCERTNLFLTAGEEFERLITNKCNWCDRWFGIPVIGNRGLPLFNIKEVNK